MKTKPFKDKTPGIFRAKNGICYVKLEKELADGEEKYNAVAISSGKFAYFSETDLVDDYGES